jgi:hypothetical protein
MHEELMEEEAAYRASLQTQPKALLEPSGASGSPTVSELPDEELREFLSMNAAALEGMDFQLPPAMQIKKEPNEDSDSAEPPMKKAKIDGSASNIEDEDKVNKVFEAMLGEQKPSNRKGANLWRRQRALEVQ